MNTVSWYCEDCGAANPPEQTTCFACQQISPESAEQESLLHKRYTLQTQVGTGGFGCVYHALDTQTHQRSVAIKQINLSGLATQQIIEATNAFNQEVRLLSILSHPHLPHVHEHFTDPEHWYLVMDFIKGETLEQVIERQQKSFQLTSQPQRQSLLPFNEILDLAFQICEVLYYLHSHTPPIIFRDLKPSNIMQTPYKKYFLIDFGIARLFKPGQQKDTIPFGSPGYAAPEQYGKAQTTPQADIYSLGALLYYLISGNDPAESPFRFASLSGAASKERREFAALVTRMIALDVIGRPAHISEVQEIIQHLIQNNTEQQIWFPPQGKVPPSVWPTVNTYAHPQKQTQIPSTPPPTPPLLAPSRRTFLLKSAVAGTLIVAGGFACKATADSMRNWGNSFRRYPASRLPITIMPAISLDGSIVIQGQILDAYTTLQITNTTTGQTRTKQILQSSYIQALALSPDNKTLFIISENGDLSEYDLDSSTNKLTSLAIQAPVSNNLLSFSPDGQYFTLLKDINPSLYIWSITASKTGKRLKLVNIYRADISNAVSLTWSPDSHNIAMGDVYGNIQIFDLKTGIKRITYFEQANDKETMYSITGGANTALSWSSKNMLATGNRNNTLFIMDALTGQTQLRAIYPAAPLQVEWSPDGRYLATSSADQILRVWDMQTRNVIKRGNFDSYSGAIFSWQQTQPTGYALILVERTKVPIRVQINPTETATRANSLPQDIRMEP